MNLRTISLAAAAALSISGLSAKYTVFPDGSEVPDWFNSSTPVELSSLGKQYVITDYGVGRDSTVVQTEAIQKVIDLAAEQGGGVIVIPEGTYLSGSLFFRPGTHLNVAEGGKLKGIDAITHYKIIPTRLEGQTIDYFAALVNADGCDGFTISGPGTIDGNGLRFYDEFWLRRKVNPKCTNLEALRPRLVYISNSKDVTVSDVNLIYSGFWTNHLYNCERVKYLNCHIYAPTDGYPKGPSTDAIDLDVCRDVLIDGCYMNVNDDAVCLKGGKGTYVDTIPGNGPVERVIVANCTFGKTNAGITFGSEAWDCKNVIMKDCNFNGTSHVVLFKMRPDTPQQYRHVLIDGVSGMAKNGVEVQRWTQFFNKVDRDPMPPSGVSDITVKNVELLCNRDFYRDSNSDYYTLENFTFENVNAQDPVGKIDTSNVKNCKLKNVNVTANADLGKNGASVVYDASN